STPALQEIAGLVEAQHRWRRRAALRFHNTIAPLVRALGGIGDAVKFHRFKRSLAMDDPDMVLRVNGDADDVPHDPMIRQRVGPHRIDFEPGRHLAGSGMGGAFLIEYNGPDAQGGDDRSKSRGCFPIPGAEISADHFLVPLFPMYPLLFRPWGDYTPIRIQG